MGEIADMMLEGGMCQWCGELLDGDGYPTICAGCQDQHNVNVVGDPLTKAENRERHPNNRKAPRTIECTVAGCARKLPSKYALRQHLRDKHNITGGN